MAFQNVVSVEESLFTVWFDPHFVLAVFGQIVKACDAQLEFPGLRELSENDTRWEQFVFAYMRRHLKDLRVQVVHTVSMESEHVLAVLPID